MFVRFFLLSHWLIFFLLYAITQGCDQVCVMACLREPEFSSEVTDIDECITQCACGPPTYPGRCLSSEPVVSLQDCVTQNGTQEWMLKATSASLFWLTQNLSCLSVLLQNRSLYMSTNCSQDDLWSWTRSANDTSSSSGSDTNEQENEGFLRHEGSGMCLVVNATVTGSDEQAGFSAGGQLRVFTCNYSSSSSSSTFTSSASSSFLRDSNYAIDADVRSEWVMDGKLNMSASFKLKLGGGGAWFGSQKTQCVAQVCLPPSNLAGYPSWVWAHRLMGRAEREAALANGPHPGFDVYDSLPRVASTWVGTQMMAHERFFYDNETYTVARYLSDLQTRFGGIDQVLIWPTYPNIGIDNRGTWDMIMSMPGGVEGVKKVVKEFQAAGVLVMFPYHPFDVGTTWREREVNGSKIVMSDAEQMAMLLNVTGADGFNGDTNRGVPYSFFLEGQKFNQGKSIILEPEQGIAGVAGLSFNTMSWNYGFQNLSVDEVRVSALKWIEPRHMSHICDRWSQDQTAAILNAFFNGFGFVAWENVWGMWNELTPRTAELLKRVSIIQRHFSRILHLQNDSFWPFFNAFPSQVLGPDGRQVSTIEDVRVTRFYAQNESLFVIVTGKQVNTSEKWPLAIDNHILGSRYFDVYHGEELSGRVVNMCLTAGELEANMQACGNSSSEGGVRADQTWSFVNGSLKSGQLCLVWDGLRLYMGSCELGEWRVQESQIQTGNLCLLVDPSARGRGNGARVAVGGCEATDSRNFWNMNDENEIVSSLIGSPSIWLSFPLEPLAIGAVYVLPQGHTLLPQDDQFFESMRNITQRALSDYSTKWIGNLPQTMLSQRNNGTYENTLEGMIKIDESKCSTWEFRVSGLELEGQDIYGVDVQYPWEKAATRAHAHLFSVGFGSLSPFFIDKNLVTNHDFMQFLNASKYQPSDSGNFLKHWQERNVPPVGFELAPVVWVSRQDAESFCSFHGKRLPEEWEWQLAAQGCDKRMYPWGNSTPVYGTHVPPLFPGRQDYNASVIGSYPAGASESGLLDLTGNVWQWTSLFEDTHTRSAILRGGTVFRPGIGGTGDDESCRHDVNYMWFGDWYFPGGTDDTGGPQPWGIHKYPEAYQLQYHAKLLMMSPSLDRSGAVGFRCAASVTEPVPSDPVHWVWILVPIGSLLVSALCIGCLFWRRAQRRKVVSVTTPLIKQDHSIPADSSYGGYDADVSATNDASVASGSHTAYR